MEIRRIQSDTYGCGNSLCDFVEIVCRCDRCEKHFSAYENESFDLCGVCSENDEIMDRYYDEAFDEMCDDIACPRCHCTDSFVHRIEDIRTCLKCSHSWEDPRSQELQEKIPTKAA